MKIYIDLVLLINTFFDFLLLISVNIILKRNIKIKKIIFISLLSSFTVFFMFLDLNIVLLNIIKLIISILMVLITFKYSSFKYFLINLFYFYIIGMFLGGFIYFINNNLSNSLYLNNNAVLLFILGPIGILLYIKQPKIKYDNYYNITIYFKGFSKNYVGYLDSGNMLVDVITSLPVIFINENIYINDNFYLVNYKTIKGGGLLKCYKAKIKINNCIKKVLVSYSDNINIDGVSCILNKEII